MMESSGPQSLTNMGDRQELSDSSSPPPEAESSMDIEQSLPTVAELKGKSDKEDNVAPSSRRRKSFFFALVALACCMVVVVVSVVVAISVTNNKKGESGSSATDSLTNMSDVESFEAVVKYLGNHDITDIAALIIEGTPANQAAKWIANEDPQRRRVPKVSPAGKEGYSFMQRYIMTLVYFQMGGPTWKYDVNFLTEVDTCDWFSWIIRSGSQYPMGAICNQNHLISQFVMVGADVKGVLPTELAKLTTLQVLELDVNEIAGSIPAAYHTLVNLQNLHLSHNELTGSLPTYLGSFQELQTLDVSFNAMEGEVPNEISKLPALRGIALDNNLFTGKLAMGGGFSKAEITAKQDQLKYLFLENNIFDGFLEATMIERYPNLIVIDVSGNHLRGPIPFDVFHLSQLQVLDLHGNQFSGPIPEAIPRNTALEFLALQKNALTGTVSEMIGNLQALKHLDIANNKLTFYDANYLAGTGIAGLKNLTYLFMAANEFDSEPFPFFLQNMTNLEELSLKSLKLVSTIPSWIGDLSNLILLDLDDNTLDGSIPTELAKLTKLEFLLLNRNKLTGVVPQEIENMKSLRLLYLDSNDLGGTMDMICERPGSEAQRPIMVADCGGSDPDIECGCCVKCCRNGEECNDDTVVPSNDPIWQFGYDRYFYSFGNFTGYFEASPP